MEPKIKVAFSLMYILFTVSAILANSKQTAFTLSDDGAWCWFQDPRAVYIKGADEKIYTGWVTRSGQLQIGSFDLARGRSEHFTLKEKWGADDHNTCSFLVLPDKRLMVFYAQHNQIGVYCRTTSRPEDITAWEDEVIVTDGPRITYTHPVYLEKEKRFYVFWRGESWKPTFSMSSDGKSWTPPRILIQEEARSATDIRPYIKITSDGTSTIHFAFTDGHPRNESLNSIYYLKYENGMFYRGDGTVAGYLGRLPVAPSKSDLVYDARRTAVRAWVWDIALDNMGLPVIAYTRLPAESDHRYHYARWIGSNWIDSEITPAGGWFPQTPEGKKEPEPHYSGGIALNPSQPEIVYLSRQNEGVFEIERWITPNFGRSWRVDKITENSAQSNVRPVVPRFCPQKSNIVLWMQGPYIHYTNFNTMIKIFAGN